MRMRIEAGRSWWIFHLCLPVGWASMFRRIKAADYATRACFIPHLLLLLLPSTLCFSMGPELEGRNEA